jgi:hypothetical protein
MIRCRPAKYTGIARCSEIPFKTLCIVDEN